MYRQLILGFLIIFLSACKQQKAEPKEEVVLWTPYNDSTEVAASADNESERMQYKFIQSKVLDKNGVSLSKMLSQPHGEDLPYVREGEGQRGPHPDHGP